MARPFRSTLILATAALGGALAAFGGWHYARASAPVSGPIIVISVAALRADHLPAYGYSQVKTPAIDRLAADGTVFERAFSHVPQTLPAHAALLSGRLPFETGVRDGADVLKKGERLLAGMLRERGYATAGVVSTYALRKDTGIGQGFDLFDADTGPLATPFDVPERDGKESEAVAERWLGATGGGRAFLFLQLHEPHAPYTAPERFAGYEAYDAQIAYADELIGRLVQFLKSHQLYDRSTIILLADHGEALGEHGEAGHGLLLHDSTLRVPLIIKQEANARPGRRLADPVQHIDLVPTILALVKAPIPGGLRGRSLKPLLDGTGRPPARPIYAETLLGERHFGWGALTSVTDGGFRYISAPVPELYDTARDPRELHNVAVSEAAVVQKMRSALDAFSTAPSVPKAVSADTREKLQAIGLEVPAPDRAATMADPKEKRAAYGQYVQALRLGQEQRPAEAIRQLQLLLRDNAEMKDGWSALGVLAGQVGRQDLRLDALRHVARLTPMDPLVLGSIARTLIAGRKFDEARDHALAALAVARDRQADRVAARELLLAVALARRDEAQARTEAQALEEMDGAIPALAYLDGRLHYDKGEYDAAAMSFDTAVATLTKSGVAALADAWFYSADTALHLERPADAEALYKQGLERAPFDVRLRAGLASLYYRTGRVDDAANAVEVMVKTNPTVETYAAASRLWRAFGKPREAEAARIESKKRFSSRS